MLQVEAALRALTDSWRRRADREPPARWIRLRQLAAIAALVACPGSVRAQPAEEPWRPTTAGPFVTITAPLTPAGKLTLQPLLFAAFQRGAFGADSREAALEGRSQSVTLNLYAEYGITERIAAGAQLAFLYNRRELAAESASASTVGLGDAQLFARWALPLPKASLVPVIALFGVLEVPLGQADGLDPARLGTDAMGSGTWDGSVGVDVTEYVWPLVLHLDLFYASSFQATLDSVPVRPGPAFVWAASVELPLPLPFWPHRWALMAELNGRLQGDSHLAGERAYDTRVREVTFGAGVELLFSDSLQLLVGYQRTLWGTNVPAFDTVALTLVPTL